MVDGLIVAQSTDPRHADGFTWWNSRVGLCFRLQWMAHPLCRVGHL